VSEAAANPEPVAADSTAIFTEYDDRKPAGRWLFALAIQTATDDRRLARHRLDLADGMEKVSGLVDRSVPEAPALLGIPVNTAVSRLRSVAPPGVKARGRRPATGAEVADERSTGSLARRRHPARAAASRPVVHGQSAGARSRSLTARIGREA
jgi:hypothetical protein